MSSVKKFYRSKQKSDTNISKTSNVCMACATYPTLVVDGPSSGCKSRVSVWPRYVIGSI